MKRSNKYAQNTALNYLKFIIPSVMGVILFMCPVVVNGQITIPIAILNDYLQTAFSSYMQNMLLVVLMVSFLGSVFYTYRDKKKEVSKLAKSLFVAKPFAIFLRGMGLFFAVVTVYADKFTLIASEHTGGLVFRDLLPILFTIFFLAGFLLPLLLNFGLLEFIGALLIKVMRPVFGLPGRAAIDAIASWLGDGTIGILLTSKQYEEGFYTEREACVIGTNFSLVSITFSLVVINTVGLSHMFLPFYLTITVTCLIIAVLLPKIPPLSRKKNRYYNGEDAEITRDIPSNQSNLSYGLEKALLKVKDVKLARSIFIEGTQNVLDMWIAVIPIVMTVGTTALILAEYTPIFRILGLPFLPILKVLGVPEAAMASQTLFAGFADMLLPSVMIAEVSSEMTRFIVAAVSVCQLIYLSEVGALLLASKIPVSFKEIFIIFIERTLIALPIVVCIAKIIF